jgi:hypothetical protein
MRQQHGFGRKYSLLTKSQKVPLLRQNKGISRIKTVYYVKPFPLGVNGPCPVLYSTQYALSGYGTMEAPYLDGPKLTTSALLPQW